MKSLVLSACLVAAATVSAAELKDPAEVSKEWSKVADQPLVALSEATSLKQQCPTRPVFPERAFQGVPAWEPQQEPSPFDGAIRPPGYTPGNKPKGAKPYQFNGETYWIIPITNPLTLDRTVDINSLLVQAASRAKDAEVAKVLL